MDKGNGVLAQQRQEAILREVERVGGVRVSELVDLILGVHGIDQVGQLIEAQPFVGEADQRPRKAKSS